MGPKVLSEFGIKVFVIFAVLAVGFKKKKQEKKKKKKKKKKLVITTNKS